LLLFGTDSLHDQAKLELPGSMLTDDVPLQL
jgi:hypothetical protein